METLLLFTVVGLILYYIINHFYRHFTYWKSQGIPANPFITFGWATKPFFKFIEEKNAKYGQDKIYGAYAPFGKILVLNDAKMARDLSTKELDKFAIRNNQFYMGTTNITKSLFFIEANEDWKRIRSIVTPAFTSGKLKRMISPIERIADNFVQHMRPHAAAGDEFDLKKYIGGFAMDVIACCGYGIELDSVRSPNHPVVVNAKKILNVDVTFSAMVCVMLPRVARLFKLEVFDRNAVNYFDKLTFDIVEKRIQQSDAKQNPDLLGLMMESGNEETQSNTNTNLPSGFIEKLKGISKDELSGQGILFFIAGFDTTHATFDHAIYYLSKHHEWQEKLYQELVTVKDELDYDKFQTLPLLNAIINETLRLNPPLTVVQRESVADCELLDTGIQIPKNTLIEIQPYIIHRNPEYFPEPLAFKPERFLGDKTNKSAESSIAFMPFGVGPRLCVGMRFAQNELRIGLANLILNYRITMDPAFELEYFKGSVLMSPKRLMVQIGER